MSAEQADEVAKKMPAAEEVKTVPVDEETAGAIKDAAGRCRQRDARASSEEAAPAG